jgi:hypothetical protein
MVAKLVESLKLLTANNMIILHLFDNISYMAGSEERGDLPIRQYGNREFNVEGDLILASKDRLFMAFPLLRLLEGIKVTFLIMLTYLQESCFITNDHTPNRYDESFEASLRKVLMEVRGNFKDFLFTSNLRFKIINPCLCVPTIEASGDPLWGEDPVHPLYGGYEAIMDSILHEANSLHLGGQCRGEDIAPAPQKSRTEIAMLG